MERTTPLTVDEIALEILKLATPKLNDSSSINFEYKLNDNAKLIAETYLDILKILHSQKIED